MTTLTAERTGFLRTVLKLDALVSGLNGIAYLAVAGPLATLFGTSSGVLIGLGVFLVAWAAVLLLVATRPRVARPAVWAIVVVNALWAVDSVVLAGTGTLSVVGSGWALLQAVVVVGFAMLGIVGLRRAA